MPASPVPRKDRDSGDPGRFGQDAELDVGVNLTLTSTSVMPVLRTAVDPRSDIYRANREAMLESLAAVTSLQETVVAGGGSSNPEKARKAVSRHRDRGKLLPRER